MVFVSGVVWSGFGLLVVGLLGYLVVFGRIESLIWFFGVDFVGAGLHAGLVTAGTYRKSPGTT